MNAPSLTPRQIENWRKVLTALFGPYALIMPESEIHQFRDRIEREAAGKASSVPSGNENQPAPLDKPKS